VNNTYKTINVSSTNHFEIPLPEDVNKLDETLFSLHREIESQYHDLPWPLHIQKIIVLTEIIGGRGDIAAAAKAIALMQKISSGLSFDWVLKGGREHNPISFLNCEDPSKIGIRYLDDPTPDNKPGDFLLAGPVRLSWDTGYIEKRISRKIAGPTFGFMENAEALCTFLEGIPQLIIKNSKPESSFDNIYQKLHSYIFPSSSNSMSGLLPMGIRSGSGVFLDHSRINAPLSREYCCPSYLLQIEDEDLRKDILEAMNVFDTESQPDYDLHSFNSGYAHYPASWGKFIDCVAIHEKNKHVVVVLNHRGSMRESYSLSSQDFQDKIFDSNRLTFLKRKGFSNVIFKGEGQDACFLQKNENSESTRSLTVIVRPSFHPNDMRRMQLASERLLSTGDNSAVEALCAKCILYFYEVVANGGLQVALP